MPLRIIYAISFLLSSLTSQGIYAQDPDFKFNRSSFQELDTNLVNSLNKKFDSLRQIDLDSSLVLAKYALNISERIDFKSGMALSLKNIGINYYYLGDYENAIDYFDRSLRIHTELENQVGISNLLSNLGAVYQTIGDDHAALEQLFKALDIAQKTNDALRLATLYSNIGAIYSKSDTTINKSIESYKKAIAIFESKGRLEEFGIANGNLAEAYLSLENPDKAIELLENALPKIQNAGMSANYLLTYLGLSYLAKNNLLRAKHYFEEALEKSRSTGEKYSEAESQIGIAKVYSKQGRSEESIMNYQNGLKLFEELGILWGQKTALSGLVGVYQDQGNFRKALEYEQQRNIISDSINSVTLNQYSKVYKMQYDRRVQSDIERRESEIQRLNAENSLNKLQAEKEARVNQALLVGLGLFLILVGFLVYQYFYVKRSHRRLDIEKRKSEKILLNILPKETADELRLNGSIQAKQFDQITVLFTDFKGFSLTAESISPDKLVASVDHYFKQFDAIVEKYGLEKIKTIGDAYMCAGGIPRPNETHAEDAMKAAIEIRDFVEKIKKNPPAGIHPFEIRIGLNSGPVVAGVVGTKKFAYDIWGSTVNFAARMESKSEPGRINVSESTYQLLKDKYDFTYRGELEVKNGQVLKMYFAEVESKVTA